MESGGNHRSRLLAAGGILSIIAGIYQIIGGLLLATIIPASPPYPAFFEPYFLFIYWRVELGILWYSTRPVLLVWISSVVLGIMAVIGGISAIRRKRFGISLAGAIGALSTVPLGILAVNFVCLGKREFEAKRIEDGI